MICLIKKLFKYIGIKNLIILLVLCLLASFFLTISPYFLSDYKINKYFIICFILGSFFLLIFSFLATKLFGNLNYNLKKDAFDNFLKVGNKNDFLLLDIDGSILKKGIFSLTALILSLIIMFLLNFCLTIIFLIFLICILFLCKIFKLKLMKEDMYTQFFSENVISSLPIIKQYGKEKEERKRFSYLCDNNLKVYEKNNIYICIITILNKIFIGFGCVLIIFISGITYLLYFLIFSLCLNNLNSFLFYVKKNKINDLELLDKKEDGIRHDVKGEIEFKNVSFYRGNKVILENLSFKINKGQVAIISSTPSEKEAIISLINKFYLPSKGDILIDGVSTKKININSLKKNVCTDFKEPYFFNGTIKENLRYNALRDKRKLESIGIHNIILKFPSGYDFEIKSYPSNIDRNERYLLSLARAILTNSKILLLGNDEFLDFKTKKTLILGLKEINKNTIILFSNNQISLNDVDKIIVIK